MKKRAIQQRTERRIAAVLRLGFVGVLLLTQIALVLFLSQVLRQRMFYAYAALEFAALVCALYIYNRSESGGYKYGWILLVLSIPVVGLTLYYLWNGHRSDKRLGLQKLPPLQERDELCRKSQQHIAALKTDRPNWARLATYLARQGYSVYGDTNAVYFPSGEAYLEDMLHQLAQAERFIFMEYYIVGCGEIWDSIKAILQQKAQQGVEIKLIFDDFGCMLRLPKEEVEALRKQGVEIRLFNPVHQYVNRLHFNYRDHRKITCIDGHISYTGGVNLADEYANRVVRFGHWKDCGVRLDGEGAWGLTREFIHMWRRLDGTLWHEDHRYQPSKKAEGDGLCQTVADGPDNNPVDTAEDVFLQLIAGGRTSVYITTPYLTIDDAMMKALCLAGDSGVDVRLMLPGIPDHKIAYWVAESYFGELLRHHVKIYCYEPGLQHGKAVAVDGEVAFVGTVNMDYRSFRLHFECGTLLYGMGAIQTLLRDMDRIMVQSRCLTPEDWSKRHWLRKLCGWVLRPFAPWM